MKVKNAIRSGKPWVGAAVTLVTALAASELSAQITLPGRRPTLAAPCANRAVGTISYGGIYYNDHSANTTLVPSTIRVGGSFRISSCSMSFAGPGKEVRVALEVLNRQPGSSGVTRLGLRGVRVSPAGNEMIVIGPDHPVYGNQSYRVVVVTYTNRRPDSYASPGLLTVR